MKDLIAVEKRNEAAVLERVEKIGHLVNRIAARTRLIKTLMDGGIFNLAFPGEEIISESEKQLRKIEVEISRYLGE